MYYNLNDYKQSQRDFYASWEVLCRYYKPKDPMRFQTYSTFTKARLEAQIGNRQA